MTNIKQSIKWWEYVRDEELKPALNFFPKGKHSKILEVGGGNGYQASKILKMGYDIISIDIMPAKPSYFDVQKIDVIALPYPNNHFDLILTSQALQHIKNIDSAFLEMNRVLKDDGVMIYIVPTSWWTIFTNFWHYCQIPKFLTKSISKNFLVKEITDNNHDFSVEKKQQNKISKIIKLFLHPLDQNSSFLHDIYYFS
jgi:ubiquinone/menaquinone biosynthesis C-methylase UbiE